ncbi:hypothetical protein G3M48_008109 [Beauveria asiatica]|uniref:Uncharacterized protein n=1 Tax=Beauveria asiatica TaxID=1069075 RepID=A0AAW0S988_9HYPO
MSNAAHILSALRRMCGSKHTPPIANPRNIIPGLYHEDINPLVSELLTSNYAGGSLELARLCLRWGDHQHPRKDEIQTRLIDLGSEQEWFQSPDAENYQSPAVVSYILGFADESDDEELANGLRPLEI